MSIYVDDNFLVGHEEALNEAIDQIESTNDYLECKFLVSEDNKKGWLGQPHVIKSLSKSLDI